MSIVCVHLDMRSGTICMHWHACIFKANKVVLQVLHAIALHTVTPRVIDINLRLLAVPTDAA